MTPTRSPAASDRLLWAAGIVFVVALVTEGVVATGIPVTHEDSAAKIARELDGHRDQLLLIAYFSIVYAVAFAVYLWKLYRLLRGASDERALTTLVLVGGVLFVTLHGVSDIGITGLLGAKLATYGYQHDQGISYMLYLMTFALDSVGDVFASLFFLAAGLLVIRSGVLPRWLGRLSIAIAPLLFLQGFGLGGVTATFGLVLDLIGFALLIVFVAASSIILLRRQGDPHRAPVAAAVPR